jgi:3-dehydrosphinganine reductase
MCSPIALLCDWRVGWSRSCAGCTPLQKRRPRFYRGAERGEARKGSGRDRGSRHSHRAVDTFENLQQKARQNPEQVLKAYSFSLTDAASSAAALEAACQAHEGRNPDAVLLCAGASTPGFFVEEDEQSLRKGMDDGYWVQAWSALVW